jgi:HK97 family phage prohead protease
MGDILEPWGAELDDFRRNPICLAQHDVNRPVARCTSIKVDGDKIPALIEFPAEGVSELADEYCRLYKSGILSAVSVGFVPIDWQPLPRGGRRYTSWTMLELSLVSLPANPHALVIERTLVSRGPVDAFFRAEIRQAADRRERAARLAQLASPSSSIADGLPNRERLRWQFAGTLAQRDYQIDQVFPGLLKQEREEALRTARQLDDGIKRRIAIVEALRR